MIDDHNRCEWVNVSSGFGSPGFPDKIQRAVKRCVCVCVRACMRACVCEQKYKLTEVQISCQCFVTVGWASGRASGLYKFDCSGAEMVIYLEQTVNDLHMSQLMPLSSHYL